MAISRVLYGFRISPLSHPPSKRIHGTSNPFSAPIQNMGIDHGRFHILVSQELLDRPDIISVFEQMDGKGISKCGGILF